MKLCALLLVTTAIAAGCSSCRDKQSPEPAPASSTGPVDTRPRKVRNPAEAGSFYPSDPKKLEADVHGFIDQATKVATGPVRILLVPHAGLSFSGRIAGRGFKQLDPSFSRVVIIAANHNSDADYAGIAVDDATHYRMPGFEIRTSPIVAELAKHEGFVDQPKAHVKHMIEIELPFLRALRGDDFVIVPLVVGRLDRDGTRRAAAELAKLAQPDTLFVFSVDLSHYYPYDRAVTLDNGCLAALVKTDAEAVAECVTDGTQVLLTMNELAARMALTPRLVSYENSGDVSGETGRVVGYGALIYEDRFELGGEEGRELTRLARSALETRVKDGRDPALSTSLAARWPRLGCQRSVFVTLKKQGELRGCIGDLAPREPLADNVVHNAVNAAVSDSRFSPVTADELPAISLSVSVLDVPRPLETLPANELTQRLAAKKPGVVLSYEGRRSTFLPQVWEDLPEPKNFLEHLCKKQGAAADCWSEPGAKYEVYSVQLFEEGKI